MSNESTATLSADRRRTKTRDALVETTILLIDADGWEQVTLAAVAQKCGVSTPATYKHFSDKTSLLKAARYEISARLAATAEAIDTVTPLDTIVATGEALIAFAGKHPRLLDFLFFGGNGREELATSTFTGTWPFLDSITSHIDNHLRRRQLDAEELAFARHELFVSVWALIQGYMQISAAGATSMNPDFLRSVTEALTTAAVQSAKART